MSTSLPPRLPNNTTQPSNPNTSDAVTVLERKRAKLAPPPFYQVVMLNDDYTPMEFVVFVIQEFFGKDHEAAIQIMLKIHLDGRGVCGVFPRDVALTKVRLVMEEAQRASHPLQCISEPLAS